MNPRVFAPAMVASMALVAAAAQAASFDCSAARTFAERTICDNADLSAKDALVSDEWRRSRQLGDPGDLLLQQQRNWLVARNQCGTIACLRDSYDRRLKQLDQLSRSSSVELQGSIAGGASICEVGGACALTAGDQETSAFIISVDAQNDALVLIAGKLFRTEMRYVSVNYRGCDLTLASFEMNSFCPSLR